MCPTPKPESAHPKFWRQAFLAECKVHGSKVLKKPKVEETAPGEEGSFFRRRLNQGFVSSAFTRASPLRATMGEIPADPQPNPYWQTGVGIVYGVPEPGPLPHVDLSDYGPLEEPEI